MTRFLMLAAAAAIVIGWAEPAHADEPRAPTLDDILSLEAFGRASISPDGRWAVYEKRGAYEDTPRFDLAQRSVWAAFDLWRVDLSQPEAVPVRLLPDEGIGLLRGDWSPSGDRLLVSRFGEGRYEYGVADPKGRSVRWTGLAAETPLAGANAQWLANGDLLLLTRPDGSLPGLVRHIGGAPARLSRAWEASASGSAPSRTVVETRDGVAAAETPEPLQRLVRLDGLGRAHTLAEGRLFDFAASPDGRSVAVLFGGDPIPTRADHIVQAEGRLRQRVVVLDLETGQTRRPAERIDAAPHLLRWNAASTEVLIWGREDGAQWSEGRLYGLGADGVRTFDMGALSVGDDAAVLRGVRAAWAGEAAVVYAQASAGTRRDWWRLDPSRPPVSLTQNLDAVPSQIALQRGTDLLGFADGRLWSLGGGGARAVTPDDDQLTEVRTSDPERVMRLTVNEPSRAPWLTAIGGSGEPVTLGLKATEADATVERLGPGPVPWRFLAVSAEAAMGLERQGLSERLVVQTAGCRWPIDAVNERFADADLAQPEWIEHRDVLGRSVRSALYLPRKGTPRGLVVQAYPGSVDANSWSGPLSLAYAIRPDLLVGAGYAVLSPSLVMEGEGAPGFDSHSRGLDLAVDATLGAWPQLRPDRIALMGHSYGGYVVLGVATRSQRYRSIIASSAPSDMAGHWGEFVPAARIQPEDGLYIVNQQGWVESGQGELGAPPWAQPELYTERSALFSADRITAPVLLITADRDYVAMSQLERMFSALNRLGGRARLITYWGEAHHLMSPANARDRLAQVLAWLEETLPDGPADAPTP